MTQKQRDELEQQGWSVQDLPGDGLVLASRIDDPRMFFQGSEEKVVWQVEQWAARRAAMGAAA